MERNGVCLKCGSALLDGEHLRDDLEPCYGGEVPSRLYAATVDALAIAGLFSLSAILLIPLYELWGWFGYFVGAGLIGIAAFLGRLQNKEYPYESR